MDRDGFGDAWVPGLSPWDMGDDGALDNGVVGNGTSASRTGISSSSSEVSKPLNILLYILFICVDFRKVL